MSEICGYIIGLAAILSSGMPQGSVLSLTIFNLFLNRLVVSLPAEKCIAYADNVLPVTTGSTLSEVIKSIQSLRNSVLNWSASHCVFFSQHQLMFFHTHKPICPEKAVFNYSLIIGTSALRSRC